MLRNITFSADAKIIEKARKMAEASHTTLNEEFRRWINQYANRLTSESDLLELLSRMNYVRAGSHFSREEMNER